MVRDEKGNRARCCLFEHDDDSEFLTHESTAGLRYRARGARRRAITTNLARRDDEIGMHDEPRAAVRAIRSVFVAATTITHTTSSSGDGRSSAYSALQ